MKATLLKATFLSLAILAGGLCSAQTWTAMAQVPINVGQHGAVAHPNGNVYVFGGFTSSTAFNSLNIYNQATDSWTTGANIPTITRGMAYTLGADSQIYCFGGYDPGWLSACYKYKPSTNTWTTLAPLPIPTWMNSAAKGINGKIYVLGGENGTNQNVNQVYDPVLNTWSVGAVIPIGVKEHQAIAAPNGKIYVIGGLNGNAVNNVQIYDPILDSWTVGAPMPTARNEFAAALGPDGKIYCIGGKNNGGNNQAPFYTVVEIYDPILNTWSTGPVLPKGLGETAAAMINNGINVFAGADSSFVYSKWNFRMNILPSGVENMDQAVSFAVYPNPVNDVIHFAFSNASGNVSIRIMDVNGKMILNQNWMADKNVVTGTFDVSSFSSGLYFIQCVSDNGTRTEKIMVN